MLDSMKRINSQTKNLLNMSKPNSPERLQSMSKFKKTGLRDIDWFQSLHEAGVTPMRSSNAISYASSKARSFSPAARLGYLNSI